MLELKKIYSLNFYSWMRTRKKMEVYNTRFPGLELHVMSWRKRTSLSGESTYAYSPYTIHKELLVLKIQFITRSELKLRESKVTNLQDQLSNAGQTPGRRQSAVGVHKSEVTGTGN